MSDQNHHHAEHGEGGGHGSHASMPQPRQLVKEMIGLLVVIAVIAVAGFGAKNASGGPTTQSLLDPHSGQSGDKIREIRAKEKEKLESYGVVNEKAGIYQVPVQVAMAQVVKTPALLGPLAIVDQGTPVAAAGGAAGGNVDATALYNGKGCVACHSLDGSPRVGPSFKGLVGRTETLTDGSKVTVDEAYIRESIVAPNAKVVQGFPPAMPAFQGQLSDDELGALFKFIEAAK